MNTNTYSITKPKFYWILIGIVIIGTLLRLYNFGDLALTGNEDYVANAVKGVLDTGLPVYPSGVLYPRALPLTYLTSLSVYMFGFEDLVLRIPSTVFSVLSIVVGYLLAVRLFGIRAAIIVALLITFSDWEILLGRTARMYGMLSFFLLLSTWLMDKAIMEGGRVLKSLSLTSIIITCFLHKLAIMLLPFHIFYFLFRQPRGKTAYYLLFSGFIVIISFYTNNLIDKHYYSQAYKVEASLIASHQIKPANNSLLQPNFKTEKPPTNIWRKILESTTVKILSEKHLNLLLKTLKNQSILALVLITCFTAVLIIYGIKNIINSNSRIYGGAVTTLLFPLCLQQMTLALLLVLVYVLLARAFEPNSYKKRTFTLLYICGIASFLWICLGLTSLEGSLLENFHISLIMLFSFPTSFIAVYFSQYPFLSICALVSALVAINRYLDSGRIDGIGYITLLFVGTTLLLGMHPQTLSRPYPRYIAFLNPYFLIMVAFSIDIAIKKLRQLKYHNVSHIKVIIIFMVTFLGFSLIVRETGYTTLYTVSTNYGDNKLPTFTAGNVRNFYPDHKSPALFVAENISKEDIVIAMDALAFYVYFPKIDFQLRATGGTDAERWLGRRTLFSEDELSEILREYYNFNIWIVLDGEMILKYKNNGDWKSIMNLIESRSGQPLFVGKDKLSSVYLIKK